MTKSLADLQDQLSQLPMPLREKFQTVCERLDYSSRLQARLVKIAQDAADQMQLDIKYLQFDLESTRRERDNLREQYDALKDEQGPSCFRQ